MSLKPGMLCQSQRICLTSFSLLVFIEKNLQESPRLADILCPTVTWNLINNNFVLFHQNFIVCFNNYSINYVPRVEDSSKPVFSSSSKFQKDTYSLFAFISIIVFQPSFCLLSFGIYFYFAFMSLNFHSSFCSYSYERC